MALSPTQILVVALLLVLMFGSKHLAGLGKGLAEGITNFKRSLKGNSKP
jgi:TatA/E family protein of Tat protein translocase